MKDLLTFTKIAFQWVGHRLFILLFLMMFAALLEGLGVSLFLPVILGVEEDNQVNNYLKPVFDAVGLPFTFRFILASMVIFFTLKSIFMVLQGSYVGKIVTRFLIDLRCKLTQEIFEADYQFLLNQKSGYLVNAVAKEFEGVMFVFRMYASILVKVIFSVMYITIPLALNFNITAVILLFGIPIYFVVRKINQKTKNYSIQQSSHSASLQGILMQALGNVKYLKATQSYPPVLDKIHKESATLGHIQYRTTILGCMTQYGFEPIAILSLAGLIFYQVEIVGESIIEVAFLIYLIRRGTSSLLSIQQAFRKFLASIGNVYVFLDLSKNLALHKEKSTPPLQNPDLKAPLSFQNVSFAYGNNKPVLKNLDFTIPARSTVAFVGDSGSGKSTLVNLLTGILRAQSGQIYLGDVPYNHLDLAKLRQHIGYITQESVIFNDTIFNNLSLWNTQITQTSIAAAAHKAHIHNFIKDLPDEYETLLGDGGVNISGGQRQRMMIARELCKQANLLIFDEATSALDSHTENEIQNQIDKFQGEKTIILIAHRLSTVRNCDIIFVLKEGEIVESGTYNDLYAQEGEFKKMIMQQNLDITPALKPV